MKSAWRGRRLVCAALLCWLLYAPGGALAAEQPPAVLPAARLASLLETVDTALRQGALEQARQAMAEAQSLRPLLPAQAWAERVDLLARTGAVAAVQGQLAQALPPLSEALALARVHLPASLSLLRVLNALGYVQRDRGALREARALLAEGIDLAAALDQSSQWRGILQHNLAQVDLARGDLAQARDGFRAAVALFIEDDPAGAAAGSALLGLAGTAVLQGDVPAAAEAEARAMQIFQTQDRDCRCTAMPMLDLGLLALQRGELAQAQQRLQRAWEEQSGLTPDGGLQLAAAHRGLAALALEQNILERADQHAQQALALEQAEAESGVTRVLSWQLLARIADRRGDPQQARRAWCAAMDALDPIELPYPGDPLAQARFHSGYLAVYLGCVRAHLDLGEPAAAHSAWRAARARGWREALMQRALAPTQPAATAARPAETATPLAPGTLLLDYAVADREILLFAQDHAGLSVHRIALSESQLRARVRALRARIASADAATLPALRAQAARLYTLLLKPVAPRLARARQLQIAADGVLHELPFAALWDTVQRRWLLEQVSIAMVDTTIGRARAPDTAVPQRLLAVADASSSARGAATGQRDPVLRAALARLPALPGARREARAVRQRFPGPGRLLLGAPATASRIRAESQNASVLHLAVHGVFDPRRPLESALLLAPEPGREDGLLPAWQVFQDWRLPGTRLVVLSACDTGLGGDFGAEGQLGLSRAFRFAGAGQVIATLWRIDDGATVELMADFYARWAGREDADLAGSWRDAVLAQWSRMDQVAPAAAVERGVGGVVMAPWAARQARRRLDHPYYWAGFVLHTQAPQR